MWSRVGGASAANKVSVLVLGGSSKAWRPIGVQLNLESSSIAREFAKLAKLSSEALSGISYFCSVVSSEVSVWLESVRAGSVEGAENT